MTKGVTTLFFILGFAIALMLYAGIDIYVFDHYEKTWGKGTYFQVSLWLIAASAIVAALGFGVGAAAFKIHLRKTLSFIVGVVFAAAVFVVSLSTKFLSASTGSQQVILIVFLLLGSFALAGMLGVFFRRHNAE